MTNTIAASDFYKWYNRKGNDLNLRVAVLEDYLGNNMPFVELLQKHHISKDYLYRTLAIYYKKPAFNITIQSAV